MSKYFSEEKDPRAVTTFQILKEQFNIWNDVVQLPNIHLNEELLMIACISIYEEMRKFEKYTKSSCGDRHKLSALIIKWISKIKPIQICAEADKDNPYLWMANSSFGVISAFQHLKIDIELVPDNFMKILIYETFYRDIHYKDLAITLYLLEIIAANKSITVPKNC